MIKIIDSFTGDFDFLSNFYFSSFKDSNGIIWNTSEHYFQAMKMLKIEDKRKIRKCKTPGEAKKLARKFEMRKDWEKVKNHIMYIAIIYKFSQNLSISEKLISTNEFRLIEGNYWHDNYWGDCKCDKCKDKTGLNILGRLLMKYRGFIIDERI